MISAVTLENYKAHANTRVELGRITMLVGPNGAGKTSVLEAIHHVTETIDTPPARVLTGTYDPDRVKRQGTAELKISVTVEGIVQTIALSATDNRIQVPLTRVGDSGASAATLRASQSHLPWDRLGPSLRFRFDARVIAEVSQTNDANPPMGEHGERVATLLAVMKLGDDERFERIEHSLRGVVPQVRRIRVRRSHSSGVLGDELTFDFVGGSNIPASSVSDGTLVTTALLTILHADHPPKILLLDDIDQALHPTGQRELMRQLKSVLTQRADLQIVASTHSPFILDALEPEDVRVFALRPDGTVAVKKLSEHPEAEKMKGSLTTGQLWTLDEEASWVVGS